MRRPSALRTAALAAVAVGVAAPLLRRRLRIPVAAVSVLAWQAPVALSLARRPSRSRAAAVYVAQMLAYVAHYAMPHDDPGALLRRVRVSYPVRADRLLGLGETPTVRLQRALGRPGRVLAHDVALSVVHWMWFLVPHGTVAYVLWRRPERFARSAALMSATFDAGLVGYWAVPTAPPWYAGRVEAMPPVRRVMVEAGERVWGSTWTPLFNLLEGNPYAAMPSLHFATSVTAAHVLSDVGPKEGAVGWAYVAALGFALVYLGEHYVVDLAAGLALAEGVRLAAPRAEPYALRLVEALRRLEPGET